ncbi:heavy metal-associated isoprenylated plant protein 47-like [Malania oleifera]|uniref:heavy metal-associated isoprenylated plant protein 47-like n=1 Tax=Malania oleifera TaxID=397392 RepID=UPI0025AE8903|nr:heavy metal-associated isoprenylated plant protein 47-like [Malania oleifera]XP_057980050.1 heavy metal-associated isoprenylated plant protein 47-like [Malania oleifera]
MKQKVVIKISADLNGKIKPKALKIAVSMSGIESVALQGDNNDQIVLTGNGIDVVSLTTRMKKRLGYAELQSVTPIEEKKKEEKESSQVTMQPTIWPAYQFGTPHYYPLWTLDSS